MSALGLNLQMIAAVTGVDHKMIYKYYSPCLMVGKTKAHMKVAQRVFALATDKEVPPATQLQACIFWLKTQAGWREGMDLNVSGEINHNTQIQINFVGVNGTDNKQLPPKRSLPAKEIGYKESEPWEPTFVGKH